VAQLTLCRCGEDELNQGDRADVRRYRACGPFEEEEFESEEGRSGYTSYSADYGGLCEHESISVLVVGFGRESDITEKEEYGRFCVGEESVLC
jgi:hypothetical protein